MDQHRKDQLAMLYLTLQELDVLATLVDDEVRRQTATAESGTLNSLRKALREAQREVPAHNVAEQWGVMTGKGEVWIQANGRMAKETALRHVAKEQGLHPDEHITLAHRDSPNEHWERVEPDSDGQ